nr:response regulator transcription factor [uncultured Clostridium sp.]
MKLLIVEDEVRLAEAMGQIMKEQHYQTDLVYNGKDGLYCGLSGEYDVIILDVMLPGENGFQIVEKLREARIQTPVLMLTARDNISDKVTGLDKGADDYMTKPFIPEELLARIRALSRRQGEVIVEEMTFGDLRLNLSTNDLCCGTKSIHLGYKEFEVLRILMSNLGKIISKDTLINRVWGSDSDAEDNNVEAYISFLRKKFNFLGSKTEITTIRKVGYRLEESR